MKVSKTEVASALKTLQALASEVDRANINVLEDCITFMYSDSDKEFRVQNATELLALMKAINTIEKYETEGTEGIGE